MIIIKYVDYISYLSIFVILPFLVCLISIITHNGKFKLFYVCIDTQSTYKYMRFCSKINGSKVAFENKCLIFITQMPLTAKKNG